MNVAAGLAAAGAAETRSGGPGFTRSFHTGFNSAKPFRWATHPLMMTHQKKKSIAQTWCQASGTSRSATVLMIIQLISGLGLRQAWPWRQSKLSLGSWQRGVIGYWCSFVPRPHSVLSGTACTWCAQKVHAALLFSTSAHRRWQRSGLLLAQSRRCQPGGSPCQGRGGAGGSAAAHGGAWRPVPWAGCSWLPGRPVSPDSRRAGLWHQDGSKRAGRGCQLCKLGGALSAGHTLSEAGLRLASGGGMGYSSIRRLLTRDPFTRGDAPTGAVG